ncbi:MAG: type IV secretory system conjugative DNA transfer family protein [Hyphomicrobiaceae bacterium]
MAGRLFIDLLLDRLMSGGVPAPKGVRMAGYSGDADRGELKGLIDHHAHTWARFRYAGHDAQMRLAERIAREALRRSGHPAAAVIAGDLAKSALALLQAEPAFHAFSLGAKIDDLSPVMVAQFIDDLSHRMRVITDEETLGAAIGFVEDLLAGVLEALPSDLLTVSPNAHAPVHADLLELAAKPHRLMTNALAHVLANDAIQQRGLFADLSRQLYRNLLKASGVAVDPERPLLSHDLKNAILPRDRPRELASELADEYFARTPLRSLLAASVPFAIPEEVRFEHTHILAGTGHGKTQALQHFIAADLLRPATQVPSMVIIDSQGDMIRKLSHLKIFDPTVPGSLADRLLIVDPSDVAFAPALNLFDVQSSRAGQYDQKEREQVQAGVIEIYDYIFAGLLGAELSQKQSVVFRFLAELMLAIPGATVHTLREALEDANPDMSAVARLSPTSRAFFEKQFFSTSYKATREQILRRLYGLLQNPSFERMFAHKRNRLDLFKVLNAGGIVLVNTAKDFLKSDGSSMFGRYIIALTLKAVFERAAIDEKERRHTFLWIDEAAEYFDDNIEDLLTQARKYKLGVVMAHQNLNQLNANLKASLMSNAATRLFGGSAADARVLAPEMRSNPDFLIEMSKLKDETQFAAYVRNLTPRAIRLTVPFGTVEGMEEMTEKSFEILREASRRRVSAAYGQADASAGGSDKDTPPPGAAGSANDDNQPASPDDSHFEPYE